MALVQIHKDDSYTTSFGNSRISYYGIGGTPADRFDGNLGRNGWPGSAAPYINQLSSRLATPTDVTVDIGGEHAGGTDYDITVRVGVEPEGLRRSVRVYCALIRDNYPASGGYHRNCLMDGTIMVQSVTIHPGTYADFEHTFSIPGTWNESDVKIIAWAQVPYMWGPAAVFQAGIMEWPFEPLCGDLMGDFDDDGVIGLGDLAGMAACLAGPDGDAPSAFCVETFDYDEDGDIDLVDLVEFQNTFAFDACS